MSSQHDLGRLRKRYGKFPLVEAVLADGAFAPLHGGARRGQGGRRSEVAMAIRRPSGGILLQTKAFYPPGTFRLPTGGIKEGEDVEHALLREVHEESNLDVEIERLVAVIDHTAPAGAAPFRSYMFLLREVGGTLKVNDPDERISGWDARDVLGLDQAARDLRNLDGTWRRWGRFRAVALEVLAGAIR